MGRKTRGKKGNANITHGKKKNANTASGKKKNANITQEKKKNTNKKGAKKAVPGRNKAPRKKKGKNRGKKDQSISDEEPADDVEDGALTEVVIPRMNHSGQSTSNKYLSRERWIGATALTTGLFIVSGLLIAGAVSLYLLKPNCADDKKHHNDASIPTEGWSATMLNQFSLAATTSHPGVTSPGWSTTMPSQFSPAVPTSNPVVTSPVFPPPTTTTTTTTTRTTTTEDPFEATSLDKISKPNFICGMSAFNYEQNVFKIPIPESNIFITNTPTKFWPWVMNVLLWDPRISKEKRYFGAANLVSPRHAITSLKFKGQKPTAKRLEVMLSVQTVTPNKQNFAVTKARFHLFREPIRDTPRDLILLTLESEMDSTLTPVCLPTTRKMPDEAYCLVLGQAIASGTRLAKPGLKRCGPHYGTNLDVASFCASDHEKDRNLCYAVSGVPIACGINHKWTLYGMEIKQKGDCREPHLFTRLRYSVNWICCYMKEIESCKYIVCSF